MSAPDSSMRVRFRHYGLPSLVALTTLICVMIAGSSKASAYWTADGSAAAAASTSTLVAPVNVGVPATVTTDVPVSWSAGVGGVEAEGYYVTRTSGSTTVAACTSSPSALITASLCTDVSVPDGEYTYIVTAVYASWTAPSASSSAVTVSGVGPAAPIVTQDKLASASSEENALYFPASAAFDGDLGTRWSSAFSDPQWVQIDLGQQFSIERVDLYWEGAHATAYEVQISDTGTEGWRTIYSTTTGPGGNESLTVDGEGRFVRMLGTTRADGYGYSLWEFQMFGKPVGNLSYGKTASASSEENPFYEPASAAFDGNPGTRWSSAFSDPQWVMVDLGQRSSVDRVDLSWEDAYATAFEVQISDTGTGDWRTLYSTVTGPGGDESLDVSGEGRFVRMLGTTRASNYGYSLWEFQVFGAPISAAQPGGAP